MLNSLFMISFSMAFVITLLLFASSFVIKSYSARWRYYLWLVIALRLLIPLDFNLAQAPVRIPAVENQTIVYQTEAKALAFWQDSPGRQIGAGPAASSSRALISLHDLLVWVWLAGFVSFVFYHLLNYLIFKRKIRSYCFPADYRIPSEIWADFKLKSKPQIQYCNRIKSPLLFGFFRPVILLPDRKYREDELALIIRHELCHQQRRDLCYKLFILLANAVHWFNPLVYLMVRAANHDLEYLCDDAVVRGSDLDLRKKYSLVILETQKQLDKH